MRQRSKPRSPSAHSFKNTHHQKLFMNKLISSAKRMRARTIEQAQGTCLTMSLDLCILAAEYDIPVQLVMWPLKNEPVFCDHWAVKINDNQVLDLTRIQVDSKRSSEVIFSIDDYPDNYLTPRFYSTAPLIQEYTIFKDTHNEQLPPELIKNLRILMLKQDLNSINHFKNFSGIASALKSYFKFRLYFYLAQLTERMHRRRDEIIRKNQS